MCEHGKRRSQCKDCGGGSICEHGRLRNRCKECDGARICEHGEQRSDCSTCSAYNFCEEHGFRLSACISKCKQCKKMPTAQSAAAGKRKR